jgi:hypothetical protein
VINPIQTLSPNERMLTSTEAQVQTGRAFNSVCATGTQPGVRCALAPDMPGEGKPLESTWQETHPFYPQLRPAPAT